jgi:hypothetical protein
VSTRTALLILIQLSFSARLPIIAGLPLLAVKMALLEWYRAAELSSDRAATLVNRDPLVTCRTMMVLAGGGGGGPRAPARGGGAPGPAPAPARAAAGVGGSGDSLFDAVRASDVDVYVTADLRHHPASELRERAAFEHRRAGASRAAGAAASPAGDGTPYLVDVAHFASEWPWLRYAAEDLEARLPDGTVTTRVSTLGTDPWSARISAPGR